MATKKTTAKKETVNEVTITMTIELTSIVKLPTNDPEKAQKAIEAEKKRLAKKFAALSVDDVKTSKEKTFVNLAE
ncbi:MAG: hypothetical protein IKU36_01980 [Bacteroidales bacterium]|nr:hypothetical protein [Bacteroidales bacterium]